MIWNGVGAALIVGGTVWVAKTYNPENFTISAHFVEVRFRFEESDGICEIR